MSRHFTAQASGILLLSCTALGGASAQTIDYRSLEQMFGQPVTTSATGKPQTVSDAPADMIVITADEIRRSGAASVGDLPGMVLKNYPGVDVQQVSLGSANVSVDGYDKAFSPDLLILVNGRQVYLDHYGYTEWSSIPVELAEIRQIEIVKGPSSALFGFNAANGVINIITTNPLFEAVDDASFSVGSRRYAGGSAVVGGQVDKDAGLQLSAGAQRSDEFRGWSKTVQNVRFPERFSARADGAARLGDATVVELEVTGSKSRQVDLLPTYDSGEDPYMTWSAKGSLTSETPIGLLSGQAYHNGLRITSPGAVFHEGVTVVSLSDLYQIDPNNTLREAAEYRHNALTAPITDNGTIAYDVLSDSLMWDWQVTRTLSWTNAGRIDRLALSRSGPILSGLTQTNASYDRAIEAYSYNSGLVEKITEEDALRLTAGQAVEAPSLLEYGIMFSLGGGSGAGAPPSSSQGGSPPGGGQSSGVTNFVLGNAETKPTVVDKYEAGYARSMPGSGITLSGSLFYQKTREIKELSAITLTTATSQISLSGNVGDSEERGAVADIAYKSGDGLVLGANYTLSALKDDVTESNASQSKGTPRHKVNLHSSYTIGPVELDLYGHYISRIYQLGGQNGSYTLVPGYFELDSRIGYHLTDSMTFSVTGTSIDLAHHREDSGAASDRRVFGTVDVRF